MAVFPKMDVCCGLEKRLVPVEEPMPPNVLPVVAPKREVVACGCTPNVADAAPNPMKQQRVS